VTLAAVTATSWRSRSPRVWIGCGELTIVPVVAFVCSPWRRGRERRSRCGRDSPCRLAAAAPRSPPAVRARAAVVIVSWLVICAIAIPFLADARLQDSRNAVRRAILARPSAPLRTRARSNPGRLIPPCSWRSFRSGGELRRRPPLDDPRHRPQPLQLVLWTIRARIETEMGLVKPASEPRPRASSIRGNRSCRPEPPARVQRIPPGSDGMVWTQRRFEGMVVVQVEGPEQRMRVVDPVPVGAPARLPVHHARPHRDYLLRRSAGLRRRRRDPVRGRSRSSVFRDR
jgi:hypothetical protein